MGRTLNGQHLAGARTKERREFHATSHAGLRNKQSYEWTWDDVDSWTDTTSNSECLRVTGMRLRADADGNWIFDYIADSYAQHAWEYTLVAQSTSGTTLFELETRSHGLGHGERAIVDSGLSVALRYDIDRIAVWRRAGAGIVAEKEGDKTCEADCDGDKCEDNCNPIKGTKRCKCQVNGP